MSSSDKPENPEEKQQQTDFGSFVSSSVRSSFQQLKNQAESEPHTPSPRSSRPSSSGTRPIGRKWRDAIGFTGNETQDEDWNSEDAEYDTEEPHEPGPGLRETFFNENGPTRPFWMLLAAIAVIVLIVLYFALSGGDDNDPADITPTATATTESVLSPDRTPSPEATENIIAPPTSAPTEEPTDDESGGGDNVRD